MLVLRSTSVKTIGLAWSFVMYASQCLDFDKVQMMGYQRVLAQWRAQFFDVNAWPIAGPRVAHEGDIDQPMAPEPKGRSIRIGRGVRPSRRSAMAPDQSAEHRLNDRRFELK
jgi:hypothetical protein